MKHVLLVCLVFGMTAMTAIAQEDTTSTTQGNVTGIPEAIIAAEEVTHDFGTIRIADGKVSHTFTIINKGNAPLVITRVIASCGCTTPEWTKEPIPAGQTGSVKVTFDPGYRPGGFQKSISVYSNGKAGSFLLTIQGGIIE